MLKFKRDHRERQDKSKERRKKKRQWGSFQPVEIR